MAKFFKILTKRYEKKMVMKKRHEIENKMSSSETE